MKGIFISLEGIDGCGKTSQIKHLQNWLPQSGLMPKNSKLIITHEPGGTLLGESLRKMLLDNSLNYSPKPITELLLYAADRAQHVFEKINPALNNGDWVLSDRFSGSTLAYQGFGRGIDLEIIEKLELISTNGLSPDLTFWLDVNLKDSLSRRSSFLNDRIEGEGKYFLERVASGFSTLAQRTNWVKINASKEISAVSKEINEVLLKKFSP